MPIKHPFVSGRDDGGDPGAVQPSGWNAEHQLTGMVAVVDQLPPAPNKILATDEFANLKLIDSATLATLDSPHLTGIPTAPTAAPGTNTDQIATMAAVQAAVDALIGGAPGALNVLGELAAALGNDANFASTVTVALNNRLQIDAAQGLNGTQQAQGRSNLGLATVAATGVYADLSGKPTLGTAAALDTGTTANKVVQLDGAAKLPAVDGSQLTNLPAGSFLQAGTGAVSRTAQNKARDIVSVKDFGAVGDGVTDDTAAIQAAITYANSLGGAQVFAPPGSYRVVGSGAQIFLSAGALRLSGSGQSSTVFLLDSSIPNTRDFIRFNTACTGILLEDFTIAPAASAVGRHLFHFDSTGAPVTYFRNVTVQRVFALATAAGHSIYLNNTGGVTVQGGVFQGIFRDNNFFSPSGFSCIKGVKAGDSLFIERNLLSGAGYAIDIEQISGAGQLNIISNNITAAGMVKISAAISVNIAFNEIEQLVTNNSTNNAIIDLDGSLSVLPSVKIISNQIQALAGMGNPTLIRVNWTTNAVIDSNYLYVPAAYAPVVVTANAVDTTMGQGNAFTGASSAISDSGVQTRGVWKDYTSTFSATSGTATVTARYQRCGNTVFVNIGILLTSAVTGVIHVTLPTKSASPAVISGQEIAMLGTVAAGSVLAGSNSLTVLKYDGNAYVGSGNYIALTGSYEAS